MKKRLRPAVLIIDDEPDEPRPLRAALAGRVNVAIAHPQEVKREHLQRADLALVDLRLERWPERDALDALALRPQNGLALAAVLRAHTEELRAESPTAFAIYSSYLPDLSGNLPPESREHIIARAHNLEWAFPKGRINDGIRLDVQIASLARAVCKLPTSWPKDQPNRLRNVVKQLLRLAGRGPWVMRAWQDMETCRAPIHELSERSHGLAFLRWLLHRILPYPCFLWDINRLAVRLRVTQKSLNLALKRNKAFKSALEVFQYKGILYDFLGPRWWRSGVEAFLWEVTRGNPFDPKSLHDAPVLRRAKLEAIEVNEPVVCIDGNYRTLPQVSDVSSGVRIQPDDWPAYAEQAWTTIDLAKSDVSLSPLVLEEDRERLK